jgi:hypothetical protein
MKLRRKKVKKISATLLQILQIFAPHNASISRFLTRHAPPLAEGKYPSSGSTFLPIPFLRV